MSATRRRLADTEICPNSLPALEGLGRIGAFPVLAGLRAWRVILRYGENSEALAKNEGFIFCEVLRPAGLPVGSRQCGPVVRNKAKVNRPSDPAGRKKGREPLGNTLAVHTYLPHRESAGNVNSVVPEPECAPAQAEPAGDEQRAA